MRPVMPPLQETSNGRRNTCIRQIRRDLAVSEHKSAAMFTSHTCRGEKWQIQVASN